MQVSVETTSGLGRRMTVQIPADQIDQQVESKLKQLARSARLDGFRPGKVPMGVVKKRYEAQVRQETAGELIASSYEEALQQENLKPAGEPNIEQTRNQAGHELEYVATFEVFPEVEPPQLSDITIKRIVAEVADTDVDNMTSRGKETLNHKFCIVVRTRSAVPPHDNVRPSFRPKIGAKPFAYQHHIFINDFLVHNATDVVFSENMGGEIHVSP